VWNDNKRPYQAGIISSDFNFVHIVINPIYNDLYYIRIIKKDEQLSNFGPLNDGAILPLSLLTPLVRLTAVNGRKAIQHKALRLINPLIERKQTIEKIIKNYS